VPARPHVRPPAEVVQRRVVPVGLQRRRLRLEPREREQRGEPDVGAAPEEEIERRVRKMQALPHERRSYVATRIFTFDEATAALAELRPVVQQMVALRGRQRELAVELEGLRARLGESGTQLGETYLPELEQVRGGLTGCVEQILAAGAQVKDLDAGLL